MPDRLGDIIRVVIALSVMWVVSVTHAALPEELRNDPEIQDLLITAGARERLRADFDKLSQAGTLSRGEASDYAAYLVDFDNRIAEQCQALLANRPELIDQDLPCPSEIQQSARNIEIPPAQLPEDEIASLEAELAEGLGEFDEMLLREQEKVAEKSERASESGGGGGGGGAGDTGDGDSPPARQGQAGKPSESQRGESPRRSSGQPRGTAGDPSESAPTREDGDRASDDDIVARQLREAAEAETDPELKKKLWEEYRRYKKGG